MRDVRDAAVDAALATEVDGRSDANDAGDPDPPNPSAHEEPAVARKKEHPGS